MAEKVWGELKEGGGEGGDAGGPSLPLLSASHQGNNLSLETSFAVRLTISFQSYHTWLLVFNDQPSLALNASRKDPSISHRIGIFWTRK